MSNGLSRLATRFLGEPESLEAAKAEPGKPLDAERAQKLGLVIPTLNEEQNLVPLLQRLHNVLYPLVTPYEILIVDGGSTDRTLDFARDYAKGHAEIKVLSDPRRSGLAAAVVHGWQNTSAPFLGAMDADLQHPPELVPALLSGVIQGADLVIASRYVNGKEIAGWSPLRRIASRLGTRLTAPLLPPNLHLTDPLSGFFLGEATLLHHLGVI